MSLSGSVIISNRCYLRSNMPVLKIAAMPSRPHARNASGLRKLIVRRTDAVLAVSITARNTDPSTCVTSRPKTFSPTTLQKKSTFTEFSRSLFHSMTRLSIVFSSCPPASGPSYETDLRNLWKLDTIPDTSHAVRKAAACNCSHFPRSTKSRQCKKIQ